MTSHDAPEIRCAAGDLRGRNEGPVAVFAGIPFAEPRRRFGPPEPVAPWTGVRDAATFGHPPPQSGLTGSVSGERSDHGWLTANVWSPDLAGVLPVMVWIHGGGYVFGTSGLPEYDGTRLAVEGEVVVVTFNHRVGFEGFGLVDGPAVNRGLLDQVAALEWVRDNIAAFGGDPDRVTLFGQSAGAGCVASLLAMPTAVGLFHRAIVQSMPGTYFTPELAADIAGVIAATAGVAPTELASVPPWDLPEVVDLVMATAEDHTHRWGLAGHRGVLLGPVVDGDVLPTDPWRALAAGASRGIDLLIGHVRDEHRLFALLDGTLGTIDEQQAATTLDRFAPTPDAAFGYRATDGGPEAWHERVHADWLFRMPTLHLAEAHSGAVHLFELTWPAPAMDGALGACHGLDVPLVFGNLTSGQPAMLLDGGLAEAESVSALMRRAWTAFATYGDPGWPRYGDRRLTQLFDIEPAVVPYPEEASRRIWADHTFAPLQLRPDD